MGRIRAELTVTGRLSDHADEQDEADDAAWQAFGQAVAELAGRPEYADLDLTVDWSPRPTCGA